MVASRYPTMLTGLGMGHHLAFNCENHFSRVGGEPLLKFNIPQKQVRHTVDCDKLLTEQEIDKMLTELEATDSVITVAKAYEQELKAEMDKINHIENFSEAKAYRDSNDRRTGFKLVDTEIVNAYLDP
jgi:hypothetical protein